MGVTFHEESLALSYNVPFSVRIDRKNSNDSETNNDMNFEKDEIELLKFSVAMYRRMALEQYTLAHKESSDKARRDSDRFSRIITNTHKIEDKLDSLLAR